MASELQRQLQLREQQFPHLVAQRKRKDGVPSLLFDSKQAKNYDAETVYSLGLSGFLELKKLEPKFSKYQKTLFSSESKRLDRTLLTKEVNARLDESIASFLELLSPYLLLRPAHSALEWLVRRYRVQDFNVDALLAAALPYHETNTFVKIVQLLDPSGRWAFLETVKQSGQPLTRPVLVEQCIRDIDLLLFILKHCTHGQPPLAKNTLALYTSLVIDYLEHISRVHDATVHRLLPFFLKGLKAHDDREFQVATYLLVSQLCSRTTLAPALASSLLHTVVKYASTVTQSEALLCAVYITQVQPLPTEPHQPRPLFSFATLECLLAYDSLHERLTSYTHSYDTATFLSMLAESLIVASYHADELVLVAQQALEVLPLGTNPAVLHAVVHRILDQYIVHPSFMLRGSVDGDERPSPRRVTRSATGSTEQRARQLLRGLANRFPAEFDGAVGALLKAKTLPREAVEFLAGSFHGTAHHVLVSEETTLFLSLEHSSSRVRALGVEQLIQAGSTSPSVWAAYRDVLLRRLLDRSPRVVARVLDCPALLDVLAPHALLEALDRLLAGAPGCATDRRKKPSKRRTAVREKALQLATGPLYDRHARELGDHVVGLVVERLAACPSLARLLPPNLPLLHGLSTADSAPAFAKLLAANMAGDPAGLVPLAVRIARDRRGARPLLLLALVLLLRQHPHLASVAAAPLLVLLKDDLTALLPASNSPAPPLLHSDGELSEAVARVLVTGVSEEDVTPAQARVSLIQAGLQALIQACSNLTDGLVAELFTTVACTPHPEHFHVELQGILEAVGPAALVRFLAPQWLAPPSSSADGLVAVRALQVYGAFLTALRERPYPATVTPLQLVLPSLLVPVASPLKHVRLAAVSTLSAMAKLPASSWDVSDATVIQAFRAFYSLSAGAAADEAVVVLPASVGQRLARGLATAANELANDGGYLRRWLCSAVGPSSSLALSDDQRRVLEEYLVAHAVTSREGATDHRMFVLLSTTADIHSAGKLRRTYPLQRALLDRYRAGAGSPLDGKVLELLLGEFSEATASVFEATPEYMRVILDALATPTAEGAVCSPRVAVLSALSPAVYTQLSHSHQTAIFSALVDIVLSSDKPAKDAAHEVAKELPLSGRVLATELAVSAARPAATAVDRYGRDTGLPQPPAKRRRTHQEQKASEREDDEDEEEGEGQGGGSVLERANAVLELLATKAASTLREPEAAVEGLFGLLGALVDSDHPASHDYSSEYSKQLVLGALRELSAYMLAGGDRDRQLERLFRVQTVVEAIRSTANPQTHQQALLLLSQLAAAFPAHVVTSVLPVFTFMGASTLRRDDNYTFGVLQQTIEAIVPPLVAAAPEGDAEARVKQLLHVFVDNVKHVPAHRRVPLFSILLGALAAATACNVHLHRLLVLLLSKHLEWSAAAQKTAAPKEDAEFDAPAFLQSLLEQLPPVAVLAALADLLASATAVPSYKNERVPSDHGLADYYTVRPSAPPVRHRNFKLLAIQCVARALLAKPLVSRAMRAAEAESAGTADDEDAAVQHQLLRVYKQLLLFLQQALAYAAAAARSAAEAAPRDKLTTAIVDTSYRAIECAQQLLSVPSFVGTITELLQHDDPPVRRRALVMLNAKLDALVPGSPHRERAVPLFIKMASVVAPMAVAGSKETALNRQAALLSLEILARHLGQAHPDGFAAVVPVVLQAVQSSQPPVVGSALVCLATLCAELGPHILPHLPAFFPVVVELLRSSLAGEPNHVLQLSVLSSLDVMVEKLHRFLGPYVRPLLGLLTHPGLQQCNDATVRTKAKGLRDRLAGLLEPRLLLPAIAELYPSCLRDGLPAATALLDALAIALDRLDPDHAVAHQSLLFRLFLDVLDTRRSLYASSSSSLSPAIDTQLEELENAAGKAFVALVLRYSERQFKPLFLRTLEWAREHTDALTTSIHRCHSFFHLVDMLTATLKTIFVPYYSYLLDEAINVLSLYEQEATKKRKRKDDQGDTAENGVEPQPEKKDQSAGEEVRYFTAHRDRELYGKLVVRILGCLHKCFLYDTDGFITKEKYERLVPAVVGQLESLLALVATPTEYDQRVQEVLVPTLGQLAVTVAEDPLWKPLNYQVLLKTRSAVPLVRRAALDVLHEFYRRLGEEFLVLLPETVPFLAELMEDSNPEVEKRCQELIKTIDRLLGEGESIASYF